MPKHEADIFEEMIPYRTVLGLGPRADLYGSGRGRLIDGKYVRSDRRPGIDRRVFISGQVIILDRKAVIRLLIKDQCEGVHIPGTGPVGGLFRKPGVIGDRDTFTGGIRCDNGYINVGGIEIMLLDRDRRGSVCLESIPVQRGVVIVSHRDGRFCFINGEFILRVGIKDIP